jgi:hypothetical protein
LIAKDDDNTRVGNWSGVLILLIYDKVFPTQKTAVLQVISNRAQEGVAEDLLWSEEKGLSPKGEVETHCKAMNVPFMTRVSVNAFSKG